MTDWGASGRKDTFEFRLVEPFSLEDTGEFIEAIAGESTITWSLDSDNLVTASIKETNVRDMNRMVRIIHTVTLTDGTSVSETLGTFFIDCTSASTKYGAVQRELSCYSALYRHTQDTLLTDFFHATGTNIVDEVRQLVEADGGTLRVLAGVDESRCHTQDVWWQPGDNKGEILQTIAGWTNNEVGVDADGCITWGPYVAPVDKAVSFTFEEGSNCLYLPGFSTSDTRDDAVNRVIAHFSRESDSDEDDYGLSGTYCADLPSTHPFSYEQIGRHKTYDMTVEPCSSEELQSQAQRYLDEHCGATDTYEIEHVGIPTLRIGDVVRYINSNDGGIPVDVTCQVREIAMQLKPGCPCKTKLVTF